MNEFIALLHSVLVASWHVLVEAAPWMLMGFVVAGLFRAFLPGDMIAKQYGGRRDKGYPEGLCAWRSGAFVQLRCFACSGRVEETGRGEGACRFVPYFNA